MLQVRISWMNSILYVNFFIWRLNLKIVIITWILSSLTFSMSSSGLFISLSVCPSVLSFTFRYRRIITRVTLSLRRVHARLLPRYSCHTCWWEQVFLWSDQAAPFLEDIILYWENTNHWVTELDTINKLLSNFILPHLFYFLFFPYFIICQQNAF